MRATWLRVIDSPRSVAAASLISLLLGLIFVYVWAPHPWGWQGIDAYHTLARELARGEPFSTTDVPWGYAYFAAAFYVLFGEHVWIPLTAQVIANALVPFLLYTLVARLADRRTAVVAALLIGALSFNTVYASTQSSDAICTVLFLAALNLVVAAHRADRLAPLVGAGILFGIAPQFRPNLVLFPAFVAALWIWRGRWRPRALAAAAAFMIAVVAVQLPWIARNYRLTGMILPTSTHGGVQLWYGTLQTGAYLESRAHNPRSVFESAPFPYTSIDGLPIIVTAKYARCFERPGDTAQLVFWTDRDRTPQRLAPVTRHNEDVRFEIPGQPPQTVVYYYLESSWPAAGAAPAVTFAEPAGGADNPNVLYVSADHFGDLDSGDDLLDIFDVVRAVRHLAWKEPAPSPRMDFDGDGAFTTADFDRALAYLLPDAKTPTPSRELSVTETSAIVHLGDGSMLEVPRGFAVQTDLVTNRGWAGDLAARRRTYTSLEVSTAPAGCRFTDTVAVNEVFYRREPHAMGRYMALAFDNIRRDPAAFAAASAYRIVRLFIIRGSSDWATTQQFSTSRIAYAAGTVLSLAYFAVFAWGVVTAWRRRSMLLWLLVPIAYVPLTICFVLTNMRYSITVQPLMFAFVAMAITSRFGGSR